MIKLRRGKKKPKYSKKGSKLWRRLKKAGRKIASFAAMLPLVSAPFVSGCEKTDECYKHNKTTIPIKRETDGKTAKVKDMAESRLDDGSFMRDEILDFINETHAISTEGIPPETGITRQPMRCRSIQSHAYAVVSGGDRGVYFVDSYLPITMDTFSVVNHEIGHLQGDYFEVMPFINEHEQSLMGFVVFSAQDPILSESKKWAQLLRFRAMGGSIERIARVFELDDLSYETLSGLKNAKEKIFIFNELKKNGGDLGALRKKIRELGKQGLSEVFEKNIRDFLELYSNHEDPATDLILSMRIADFMEVFRRFGADAAMDYFDSHSAFPYSTYPIGKRIVSEGLEGMNCINVTGPSLAFQNKDSQRCSTLECMKMGATMSGNVEDEFHCVSAEVSGDSVDFKRWRVRASGTVYYYENLGVPLIINGESYWHALIRFGTVSKEPAD